MALAVAEAAPSTPTQPTPQEPRRQPDWLSYVPDDLFPADTAPEVIAQYEGIVIGALNKTSWKTREARRYIVAEELACAVGASMLQG